jgi:Eco57I restriction-modification methylase
MIPGLSGSLLSHEAVGSAIETFSCAPPAATYRRLQAWHTVVAQEMGPTSTARVVFDRIAVPLGDALGFRVAPAPGLPGTGRCLQALLAVRETPVAVLLATEWGRDPAAAWREGVRCGIGSGLRWCLCITGPTVRIIDARRTYSRRFAQFDLDIAIDDPVCFAVFWRLLNADAFAGSAVPALDRAVTLSEQHRAAVRASLQQGVHDALGSLLRAFAAARRTRQAPRDPAALLDESLVVIYRILFLLFAEARGLVPKWHPTYRDSYTIESLRAPSERLARPAGLWESLQAIARLAHRGCRAGALRVPPFNGRLFSPTYAPLAESLALDDGAVRDAMVSLTTRASVGGRQRIAYAELGVEQLGGVYERVLDFVPASDGAGSTSLTLERAGRRKATGTFYTPRGLTEFLVRRALAPLVCDAGPDDILSLRVLDPAMGSGAFLVAACRYLAAAYESALIRDGVLCASDIGEKDRAGFRRSVAQRCLFGVDINPMAVQLGRLSLWLATLAGDRPLTFLDHHLRTGNSIAGSSLQDILRQPPSSRGARTRAVHLPLFDIDQADEAIAAMVAPRLSLARDPGDTIEQVRAKERLLASLQRAGEPLAAWKAVADLWCAAWFRRGDSGLQAVPFGALVDELLGREAVLPRHVSAPLLDEAKDIAGREQFFHWPLEFPEVFHDLGGRPAAQPGFDAVIGNPPWQMLRGDRGSADGAAALTAFTRSSGVYSWQSEGHANLYQVFLERALNLVRSGGRLAMVLPSGFAIDHGCAALRRAVLDRTVVDTFVAIENRDGLFPIHRGLKFLLLTATRGGPTTTLCSRAGVRSPDTLDTIPDIGDTGAISLPRSVIETLAGDQLAIPDVRTSTDVSILSRAAFSFPALSAPDGWGVTFGRELNATDDREHFGEHGGGSRLPVIEGKHIQPFVVDVSGGRFHIPSRTAALLLGSAGPFTRARLAYRDVASPANRLTLIAAMVPANVVTTHTLFCLKTPVDEGVQWFLCGIFNSYAANYLVRMRVNTHVTVSIIERLPVPKPPLDAAAVHDVVTLSRRLSDSPLDGGAAADLQARVAYLYELSTMEFQHVLDTFPLIPLAERSASMSRFLKIAPRR